jgi:hypothetical protein
MAQISSATRRWIANLEPGREFKLDPPLTIAELGDSLGDSTLGRVRAAQLDGTAPHLICRLVPRRSPPLVTREQLQRAQLELLTCATSPSRYGVPQTTICDPDDASQVVIEESKP